MRAAYSLLRGVLVISLCSSFKWGMGTEAAEFAEEDTFGLMNTTYTNITDGDDGLNDPQEEHQLMSFSSNDEAITSFNNLNESETLTSAEPSRDEVKNLEDWTNFRWMLYLFDHHKFDESHLKNVTTACRNDMLVYLDSLDRGVGWATKMYDASGRYNGQFFFGNNFWLGSLGLCKELQYNITAPFAQDVNDYLLQVPPFETAFSTAVLEIRAGPFTPQPRILLLGVCLPNSCGAADIKAILDDDAIRAEGAASIGISSLTGSQGDEEVVLRVVKVRSVPGPYNIWSDHKFYIICGATAFTFLLIALGTAFEVFVNYKNELINSNKLIPKDTKTNSVENNNKPGINMETRGFSGGKLSSLHIHTGQSRGGKADEEGSGENKKATNIRDLGEKEEMFGTSLPSQILLCFSALSNTERIMDTSETTKDAINCIHGLRFLSLGWVIMVHTYLQLFSVADNKTLRVITERNFFYQTVGNASYSVDTFFFISGLLLTYLYQKIFELRRKKHLTKYEMLQLEQHHVSGAQNHQIVSDEDRNITGHGRQRETFSLDSCYALNKDQLQQVLQPRKTFCKELWESVVEFFTLLGTRFLRLTPPYLFAIGLNLLSTKYIYNNSVFEPIINEHSHCDKYWWRNILYINNFYPGEEMCMKWSWYMANDTQFYIIGIILMILSKRHPKLSLVSIGVLMVASWVTTGYISITNNYRAKIRMPFELFDKIYVKPWARLGPYLVGMLTGWYLWRWNGRIVLPGWVLVIGWPLTLALMAILIYGMLDGYLGLWSTAFYTSMGHTAWSIALGWVVICCVAHRGGVISRILSYRGVFPLSRLAYCAYLVHVTLIIYTTYSSDGPMHLHNGIVLIIYAGLCVMSYLLSFVMSLCFEVPVVRLLKLTYISAKRKNT